MSTTDISEWKVKAATYGFILLALALGTWGYWSYLDPQQPKDWANVFYNTLLLFVMDARADGSESRAWPWQIHAARFAAPLSIAWPAGRAIWAQFEGQRKKLRLSNLKNHVVVIGGGRTARSQAREFLGNRGREGSGDEVVQVPGASSRAELAGGHRFFTVAGEVENGEILKTARVERARTVIVATGDDHRNARVARRLVEQVQAGQAPQAPISCHLEMSSDKHSPLQRGEVVNELRVPGRLVTYLFQTHTIAARELLRKFSPNAVRSPDRGDPPLHVLVVGFEPFGREVVKQLIRVCHYLDHQSVLITIVAENAERPYRRFEKSVPALKDVAQVQIHYEDPGAVTSDTWDELQERGSFDRAYVTTSDPSDAYAVSMDAKDGLGTTPREPTEWVVLCGDRSALAEEEGQLLGRFDPTEASLVAARLRGEDPDELARALHGQYLRDRRHEADFERKPADREWDDLRESDRNANRDASDHHRIKRHLCGLEEDELLRLKQVLGAATGDLARCEEEFTRLLRGIHARQPERRLATLDQLAELEHRRWMASKALDGYRHGPRRDDKLRHHPNMEPYSELDETTQAYDKKNVFEALLPGSED